eukprot:11156079-Alexandrium_andersonii.AAC.1
MGKSVALVDEHGVRVTVARVHEDARCAAGGIEGASARAHALPVPLERADAPVGHHQVVCEVAARKVQALDAMETRVALVNGHGV